MESDRCAGSLFFQRFNQEPKLVIGSVMRSQWPPIDLRTIPAFKNPPKLTFNRATRFAAAREDQNMGILRFILAFCAGFWRACAFILFGRNRSPERGVNVRRDNSSACVSWSSCAAGWRYRGRGKLRLGLALRRAGEL